MTQNKELISVQVPLHHMHTQRTKKISKLGLSDESIKLLASFGYEELYPPQAATTRAGVLKGKSVLVSAPTASGKTLIAILAMLGHLERTRANQTIGSKIIYLSPLRALATEKYIEFKKMFSRLHLSNTPIRVAISTGDYDGTEKRLERADVLILTNEKMDAVMRHNVKWIDNIGLVISDEIHLIGDEFRGPALEMVMTRLHLQKPKPPQIVGLSATITNANEIARWLGCKLVSSEWRPVPLVEGVFEYETVTMNNGEEFTVKNSSRGPAIDLSMQSVANGGQSLIFANTRARAKSLAVKAAGITKKTLAEDDKKQLGIASAHILSENENTELVKILATTISKGAAFHHAGLNQNCRDTVEEEFRRGNIKILASTPTLAAGVNLPARRVVISNITRFDIRTYTNTYISVLEYKQFCGRAGRPQYDKYGEAIIVSTNSTSREELTYRYVDGKPEKIESKITNDKQMRIHLLSTISSRDIMKESDIEEFFLNTLGGKQMTDSDMSYAISLALDQLLGYEMIEVKKGGYTATSMGRKAAMLYIDPATAAMFRDALNVKPQKKPKKYTFGIIQLITEAEEFFPKFSLRSDDYRTMSYIKNKHRNEMFIATHYIEGSRSLLALYKWIEEASEKVIAEHLKLESGDMHRITETAYWLCQCLLEIAKQIKRIDLLDEIRVVQTRIEYGIQEQLVDLVYIKGIGRVRARSLYNHNIKNIKDINLTTHANLARVSKIGQSIASNIKNEIKKAKYYR